MSQNDSMLLTSLATVPVPRPPMWITLALNDCSTGKASSDRARHVTGGAFAVDGGCMAA
jgi:hypothetical protein